MKDADFTTASTAGTAPRILTTEITEGTEANAPGSGTAAGAASAAASMDAILEEVLGRYPEEAGKFVDGIMGQAEVVPWGGRWAAQVPQVIGPCLADEWLTALNELRARVSEDVPRLVMRIVELRMRRERERLA